MNMAHSNAAHKEPSAITADIVTMTPELAKKYLESNNNNRPMRRPYVNELVEAMERGEWMLNGETIKFSRSGTLLDGQHRLAAVVASRATVQMVVVRDVDDRAFTTIDMNRRRTSADALSIGGYPNATTIAAAIRLILIVTADPVSFHTTFSHSQIKEWADAFHDDLQPHLKLGKMVARSNLLQQTAVTALSYLFSQGKGGASEAAPKFFARLADGIGLESGDPVLALRVALITNATSSAKLPVRDVIAMTIKAWNYTRDGRDLKIMQWRTDEGFPTIK